MSARRAARPRGRRPGAPGHPRPRSSRRPGSRSRTRASPVRRSAAVAADAGVDPALVHHYFGTKDDLFLAALELPVDPRAAGAAGRSPAGVDGAGERLLRVFLVGVGRPATPGCRCSRWCAAASSEPEPAAAAAARDPADGARPGAGRAAGRRRPTRRVAAGRQPDGRPGDDCATCSRSSRWPRCRPRSVVAGVRADPAALPRRPADLPLTLPTP